MHRSALPEPLLDAYVTNILFSRAGSYLVRRDSIFLEFINIGQWILHLLSDDRRTRGGKLLYQPIAPNQIYSAAFRSAK